MAAASFCPHCGEVAKEGFFEKITKTLGSSHESTSSAAAGKSLVPSVIATLVGVYFLYIAIANESIQGLIIAILSIFFAVRSIFFPPQRPHDAESTTQTKVLGDSDEPEDALKDKFFCENCGLRVQEDAGECPKCGMKFGR